MTTALKAPIVIRVGTRELGPTVNTETAGELLGVSDDTIRRMCAEGAIPTLPRRGDKSGWRIPTARALDALGIPYEVAS